MPEVRIKLDKSIYDVLKKIIDEKGITWSQLFNSLAEKFIEEYRASNELPLDLEINSLYFKVVKLFSLGRRIDDAYRMLQRVIRVSEPLALPYAVKLNQLRSQLFDEAYKVSQRMKERLIQELGEWKWYEYESEYRKPRYDIVERITPVSEEERAKVEEMLRAIRKRKVMMGEEEKD